MLYNKITDKRIKESGSAAICSNNNMKEDIILKDKFNSLHDEIKEKLYNNNKYLKLKIDYEVAFKKASTNIFSNKSILTKENLNKELKKKKQYWVNNSVYNKKDSIYSQEINILENEYLNGAISKEEFENKTSNKLKTLKDWKNGKDSLCTYKYLSEKKLTTILNALAFDIEYYFVVNCMNGITNEDNKYSIRMKEFSKVPIQLSSKGQKLKQVDSSSIKDVTVKDVYEDTIQLDSGSLNCQLLLKKSCNIKLTNEVIASTLLKLLNVTDVRIFHALLDNVTADFYSNNVIMASLSSLSKTVFKRVSKVSKEKIAASLYKMAYMTVSVFFEDDQSSFNLSRLIKEIDINGDKVYVEIGNSIKRSLLAGEINIVANNELNKLQDNSLAETLMFFLQEIRIERYYSGKPRVLNVLPDYFDRCVYLGKIRATEKKKKLFAALKLIEDSGSIIESVSSGSSFKIIFKQVLPSELQIIQEKIKNILPAFTEGENEIIIDDSNYLEDEIIDVDISKMNI